MLNSNAVRKVAFHEFMWKHWGFTAAGYRQPLQLEDFWGSKNACIFGDVGRHVSVQEVTRHLYWIINFIKENKNKQFLLFMLKMQSRTVAGLWFTNWHLPACPLPQQRHKDNTNFSNSFFYTQNFWRFWKQTWTVSINK